MIKNIKLVFVFIPVLVWISGCASSSGQFGPKVHNSDAFTAVVVAYAPEMEGILQRIEQDPHAQTLVPGNLGWMRRRQGGMHRLSQGRAGSVFYQEVGAWQRRQLHHVQRHRHT